MSGKRCSIIFCGGCNPKINRGRIAESVSSQLAEHGYQVSYNNPDVDFVIYLSGCSVSCAKSKNQIEAPFVVIAGTSVDSITIEEKSLVAEIITRGRNHFGKF
jgi:hypothetical protein